MTNQSVNPSALFRSLDHGFSQAVLARAGRTLYVSGQTAWDSERRLVGGAADPGFLVEVEATAVLGA